MKLTIDYLENKFLFYNVKYFYGALRIPMFKIISSSNRLGYMRVERERNSDCSISKKYTIAVSKYYDRTEKEYDNTLIHEMIHLYIDQQNIKDTSSHGRIFKQECFRINDDGWDLSRCTDTSKWKLSNEAQKRVERKLKNASYNVIVYREPKGTQFIFRVSNGNEQRYYDHLKNRCKLECKMFVSNDPIFDKLPNCRNRIRGHRISENDLIYKKYML